jgi:hypothetical protein
MARLASPSGEHSEDAHASAAGVADQDIAGEHTLEEVGPVEPTARGCGGLIGSGCGDDRRAEMVVGREDTMIAGQMTARWRDQGGEATQEVQRRERDRGAAVPQGTLQIRETTTRPVGSSESPALATGDLAP